MHCGECKFWSSALSIHGLKMSDGFGECRRRAPVGPVHYGVMYSKTKKIAIVSAFAPTAVDDWCGEFVASDIRTGGEPK